MPKPLGGVGEAAGKGARLSPRALWRVVLRVAGLVAMNYDFLNKNNLWNIKKRIHFSLANVLTFKHKGMLHNYWDI
jgi:hypothetical protein